MGMTYIYYSFFIYVIPIGPTTVSGLWAMVVGGTGSSQDTRFGIRAAAPLDFPPAIATVKIYVRSAASKCETNTSLAESTGPYLV